MKSIVNEIPDLELYVSGSSQNLVNNSKNNSNRAVHLDHELVNSSIEPVPQSLQKCTNFNDKLLYIYTSGTTGQYKCEI